MTPLGDDHDFLFFLAVTLAVVALATLWGI